MPIPLDVELAVGHLVVRYVTERRARAEIARTTASSYRSALWQFARHVGTDRRIARVQRRHVEAWLESMDVSPASKRNRLSAVRNFYAWAGAHGYTHADPSAGIPSPREPRRMPRGLRKAQVAAALAAAPDARARLILLLMAQEGCRALEVANLQLGDLDLDERVALVSGKARNERLLPVSDETWEALLTYRGILEGTGPVVLNSRDPYSGIKAPTVSRIASATLRAGGVQATGHQLRHTCASDLLRAGANLREVQQALGHVSLSSTQRYLGLAAVPDLRRAMAGRRYGRSTPQVAQPSADESA